jgi:LruC domain-containing protein
MKKVLLFLAALALLGACKKEPTVQSAVSGDIREINVPNSFNYKTAKEIPAIISVKDLNDNALEGVRIDFYDQDPLLGGNLVTSGFTSDQGQLSAQVKVPAYLEEVFVACNYKGFANTKTVGTTNINIDFGGKPATRNFKTNKTGSVLTRIPAGDNLYYVGSFSSNGLPNYLVNPGDQVSTSLLDDLNATLPSGQSVPNNNPQYLATSNEFDIAIDAMSDVWMTFLSEGAGYKNSLAYFVYDTGNPPVTESDIDSIFILLPNASLAGAGGNLNAGDKVFLGTFPAGKTISWVLLQNAYSSSSNTVSSTAERFYSLADLNPESNSTKRQHTVQFVDNGRQLSVNGFEDLNRQFPSANPSGYRSDNDFEDLLFYVTANPWSGIDNTDIYPLVTSNDEDGDGVKDDVDAYPNDAQRASDVNFSGSIGFEDLWPTQGDYDFNDLVMAYDITHVMNAQNEVIDVEADWTIRAVGAGFKNGFGWEFEGITPSAVASVTGSSLQDNIVTLAANGTESGQSNATVIAFDNVFNEIQHVGGPFINTVKSDPQAAVVTKSFVINFSNPQSLNDVGLPPYNPFIFVDGVRSKEIHLADKAPTDLADQTLFGTFDDDSDAAQNRFYKTPNNLPFALHVYGAYAYPVEYVPINGAHLNFSQWAQSGGTSFNNWFLDLPGYRDLSKIY